MVTTFELTPSRESLGGEPKLHGGIGFFSLCKAPRSMATMATQVGPWA